MAKDKSTGEKKLTIPQTVTLVINALDEGDASKISELEPIAAKIPMADCVELLEHAAANCDGAAIDALYDLLAPFECVSTALLASLFSGNVAAAKALVAHGADLNDKLRKVDDKRTPAAKRDTREKRYSHGYRDLSTALMRWRGSLRKRTKESAPCPQPRGHAEANAAETLIAISGEKRFKKSIAIRLLWNLISFDGEGGEFDADNARKIFEAGILDDHDLANLPWADALSSVVLRSGYGCRAITPKMLRVVKDFAPVDDFLKCWRPAFAKEDSSSKKYVLIERLLIFIDALTIENCDNPSDVLKALVATGNLESLKKLAEKPGWFTKQRIKKLVGIASEYGETEITAWLLELSNAEESSKLPRTQPGDDIPVGDTRMSRAAAQEQFGLKNIGSSAVMIRSYKGESEYEGDDLRVVIPSFIGKRRVSALADRAFGFWDENNMESFANMDTIQCCIETVELPLGMETIGDEAFAEMAALRREEIPFTVTTIGKMAFYECDKLEEVLIANPDIAIGENAFEFCESLERVLIDGEERAIYTPDGTHLIYCPRDVNELDVKEGVTVIDDAFRCCDKLRTLRLPASFENETDCFPDCLVGCDSLQQIIVHEANAVLESIDGAVYCKEDHRLLWTPKKGR